MSDTNYNKNCEFSEQTVSYLYGEITADEKTVFEEHLEDCTICADEIAGFGLARSAVIEWRETDFQLLNAPKIEVSIIQAPKSTVQNYFSNGINGWLKGLREFFAASPIWIAGAACFLILGGLLLVIQSFKSHSQIAATNNGNSQQTLETLEIASAENNDSIPSNSSYKSQSDKHLPIKSPDLLKVNAIISDSTNDKKSTAVKLAVNSSTARKILKTAEPQKIKSSYGKYSNTNALVSREDLISKRRLPKLNNFEEEEEDSTLRLTNLLDDEGGK